MKSTDIFKKFIPTVRGKFVYANNDGSFSFCYGCYLLDIDEAGTHHVDGGFVLFRSEPGTAGGIHRDVRLIREDGFRDQHVRHHADVRAEADELDLAHIGQGGHRLHQGNAAEGGLI